MKVAIDQRPLTSGDAIRGIGFHTRELITHLERESRRVEDLKFDIVDFTKADLSKYDIVHYQYFHPHFLTLPFNKPAKKVIVTIHDLIRLIYPEAYPSGVKGSLRFLLQKYNLRNVDAVITISETSKKDIVRFLGINPDKIFVTYLAPQTRTSLKLREIDLATSKKKFNLPEKFVLYVGDVNYNKNLLNLAEACKIAKVKLVIVGKQAASDESYDNLENASWAEFLQKYRKDRGIIRLGYLEPEEFEAVFKLATLYCQPSLYEGFGLPLLEAFQRGLPVVSTRTQALVEVGEEACIYVDPNDPHDMAMGMKKILDNKKLASELIKKGRERAKEFSWDKTAKQTYEVYKKVNS